MKYLIKFGCYLLLLFACQQAKAQKPDKLQWNNNPVVYINFENKTILKTVFVSDEGLLAPDILPEKILLVFSPDKKKKISNLLFHL